MKNSDLAALRKWMIGVLLALLIFHQMPGNQFWIALAIMAAGVYINVKDIQETES